MTPAQLASDFWTIIGGALSLKPAAFAAAVRIHNGWYFTTAVVLFAGLSEAIGQSVVLFANKVKPARFVFSLLVNAVLFVFGYAFVVTTTWAIMALPGGPHLRYGDLAVVLALSYVPVLFSFLVALPYLGRGIGWLIRTLHLVAMVVAVAGLADIRVLSALVYVGAGWFVLAIAQQTIGRPVAMLGARLLNTVAGVEVTANEDALIERISIAPRTIEGAAAAPAGTIAIARRPHSSLSSALLGGGMMLAIGYVCSLTLAPLHHAAFGWQAALPKAAQLPLDLVWIGIIGVLVAGFVAPFETLGWWAGWYGGDVRIDPPDGYSSAAGPARVSRYVVYLDGISQSGEQYMPDVELFLDQLAPRLPRDVCLVRGVMAYSVINRSLDDDPFFAWLWRFVDKLRLAHPTSLLGMIVNVRNVLIVAVSADTRYGPIYNFGIAQLVYDALIASGYRRGSGTPVTFIGYSGGGQMSAACAAFVARAIDAPVDVISLGGVISGNCRICELEHLYHFRGAKDGVERLGPTMFPSRWKLAVTSNWNRAVRLGRLNIFGLGPVGHNVPGGLMDPALMLPDGRSALEQTLDSIELVLHGRIDPPSRPDAAVDGAYRRFARSRFGVPDAFPIDAFVDPAFAFPIAPWNGRLILPDRAERDTVDGAGFEVHHAPPPFADLIGQRVALRFEQQDRVQAFVRAATRDVHFSPSAQAAAHAGIIVPARLDGRRLVGPIESLAGAHPIDDVTVALAGDVTVERDALPIVRVTRAPVQISGRFSALVCFERRLESDTWGVRPYDASTAAFSGAPVIVRIPRVAVDVMPAMRTADPRQGWYLFGAPGRDGIFTVTAMLPQSVLAVRAGEAAQWKAGDRALAVHVARSASRDLLAFGIAEAVICAHTGTLRFDIVHEIAVPHNAGGAISGAQHVSRALGDRWFGHFFGGPTRTALIALPGLDLEAIALQLDAMTSRYRTGDGTGAAFDGFAGNATIDLNRALAAGLAGEIGDDLRGLLAPFGGLAQSGGTNPLNVAPILTADPIDQVRAAIGSFRTVIPGIAFTQIVKAFAQLGARIAVRETEPERPSVPASR